MQSRMTTPEERVQALQSYSPPPAAAGGTVLSTTPKLGIFGGMSALALVLIFSLTIIAGGCGDGVATDTVLGPQASTDTCQSDPTNPCTGCRCYVVTDSRYDAAHELVCSDALSTPQCVLQNVCGNSIVDTGEGCDDGNFANGDGCDDSCQSEAISVCGNGVLEGLEVCDDGNISDGDGCSADCLSDETCGNSVVDGNAAVPETCDDGNTAAGDGCDDACQSESVCGDGVTEGAEACDDGNTIAGDGCSADCLSDETCGNGVVDPSETCDDGNTTAGDGCDDTCQSEPVCGDGVIEGAEVCDDGNTTPDDGCSADCLSDETCGNSIVDTAETCDDGNTTPGDGCSADCLSDETCGNSIVDTGETCDDGNTTPGDGCDSSCQTEIPPGCGDGNLDSGEVCDDGNVLDGDGCSADCLSDETCGNLVVDGAVGEDCDDGNTTDQDECKNDCTLNICGDGVVWPNIQNCDDQNLDNTDGCTTSCQLVAPCAVLQDPCVDDDGLGNYCDKFAAETISVDNRSDTPFWTLEWTGSSGPGPFGALGCMEDPTPAGCLQHPASVDVLLIRTCETPEVHWSVQSDTQIDAVVPSIAMEGNPGTDFDVCGSDMLAGVVCTSSYVNHTGPTPSIGPLYQVTRSDFSLEVRMTQ